MNLLIEQSKILSSIKVLKETFEKKLISSLGNLDEEIDKAVEGIKYDDPEVEQNEAYFEIQRTTQINKAMNQELLNICSAWLYHSFEKDCARIFGTYNFRPRKHIPKTGGNTGHS